MPPALLALPQLVPAILGIMDQDIDPAHRLQDRRRELLAGMFMIGDISDPCLGELEHIAEGSIRMCETERRDADRRVDFHSVATREFAEINLRPEQILHLDREKGVLD